MKRLLAVLATVVNWALNLVGGYVFLIGFAIVMAFRHVFTARDPWISWRDEAAFWGGGVFTFCVLLVCLPFSAVNC